MSKANELWQLYGENGQALAGQGAARDEVFTKGLLHAAAQIWIWRRGKDGIEVLLQKRAADKKTWPGLYDISAAGHIDLGETPLQAAIRETHEELGLKLAKNQLKPAGVHRAHLTTPNGAIENEFQYLYTAGFPKNGITLQVEEVESIHWLSLGDFKTAVLAADPAYLPHGQEYYQKIITALELAAG